MNDENYYLLDPVARGDRDYYEEDNSAEDSFERDRDEREEEEKNV